MRVKPQLGQAAQQHSINPLLARAILIVSIANAVGFFLLHWLTFDVHFASAAADNYKKIAAAAMSENVDKYDGAALASFVTTMTDMDSRTRKKLLAMNTSQSAEIALAEFIDARISLSKTADIKTEITAVEYKKEFKNVLVQATSKVNVKGAKTDPKPVRELFVIRMGNDRGVRVIERFGHCTGTPDLDEDFDEFEDTTKSMCTNEK